jgi:hypothetical protein
MDERGAGLLGVGDGRGQRVFEVRTRHLGLGAVVTAGLDLRHRRVEGDVDARVDSELTCRPGDRLTVVAGTGRDDTGFALGGRKGRELVDGAADLEGAGSLQVLGLQPHLTSGEAGKRLRRIKRRDGRDICEPRPRLFDVSECGYRP